MAGLLILFVCCPRCPLHLYFLGNKTASRTFLCCAVTLARIILGLPDEIVQAISVLKASRQRWAFALCPCPDLRFVCGICRKWKERSSFLTMAIFPFFAKPLFLPPRKIPTLASCSVLLRLGRGFHFNFFVFLHSVDVSPLLGWSNYSCF